jgi:hypothetical protein
MSILLAVLLASSATLPSTPRDEIVINDASELVALCREETEARFTAKGLVTYQWISSYKSRGNTLFVDGTLRIQAGKNVKVACRLARGARLGYMSLDISEP